MGASLLAIDVLHGAFVEDAVAEGFSDCVDILVLEHQGLVDLEVAEPEFIERGEGFLEGRISLLGKVFVVEYLW